MVKWTVKPAGTGNFDIINETGMAVCTVMNGKTRESREKTARLIAVAPDLLAALKWQRDCGGYGDCPTCPQSKRRGGCCADPDDVGRATADAIAKATE